MLDDTRRALALVGVVLSVGCNRARDRGAAADSSPATTATPGTMTVTERGIGPLRAGMTLSEASAALGGTLAAPSADTAGCHYVQWRGGPTGVRVMVEGGRIARVDVDSVGVR